MLYYRTVHITYNVFQILFQLVIEMIAESLSVTRLLGELCERRADTRHCSFCPVQPSVWHSSYALANALHTVFRPIFGEPRSTPGPRRGVQEGTAIYPRGSQSHVEPPHPP